ncbi:SPOR domain-containing protein [Labilibacter sediminis]|nr:SPOR domain-containing protein [Labilibacter sediminis]
MFVSLFCVVNAQKRDKLQELRTSKKIVSVTTLSQSGDYAIQIIALKYPAEDPSFFKNVEEAREFNCADGYMRYCVGSFNSLSEARGELVYYKDLGYSQAFVVNTSKYNLIGDISDIGFKADPNKTYTIQLSAYRFPVYLNHFEGIENVMEFYLEDRIYRYTVGKYKYEDAKKPLAEIKAQGYKDAYIAELDAYLPYQIE